MTLPGVAPAARLGRKQAMPHGTIKREDAPDDPKASGKRR
jgi:hypothetical protein